MSWSPNDLVTDKDLLAYEQEILKNFGRTEWTDKRAKALEDWLWPQLRANKFPAERFRTRYQPDKVWAFTASAYVDETADAKSQTADDLNFAGIFATPASDFLYVGSTHQFRGLSIRVSDTVSSADSTLTVKLWTDTWETVQNVDGTVRTAGKTLSGGGAVTWRIPPGWVTRPVNSSAHLYWARLSVSAVPTSGVGGQIGVIRRSMLCGPATLRTLALIMREAPTMQDGPWRDKADWYERQADEAFARVLPVLGSEFDTLTEDDQISEPETAQTSAEATQGGWTLERG